MTQISLSHTPVDGAFPPIDPNFIDIRVRSTEANVSTIVDHNLEFRENTILEESLKGRIATEIEEVVKNSINLPSSKAFFLELSSKPRIMSILQKYSHIGEPLTLCWGDLLLMNTYMNSLAVQNRDRIQQGFNQDFYLLLGIIHEFHTSITKNSPR